MSTREIQGHLRNIYGIDMSPDLVSVVTDAVLEEWPNGRAEALRLDRAGRHRQHRKARQA